tara:strand:- start:509 stop:1159 length:651 start_codon:yes stop_codon:yes gene_type:complete
MASITTTITLTELTQSLKKLNITPEIQKSILDSFTDVKQSNVVEPPKIPIPFCGKIEKTWCCGIRKNHRLYTQCTKPPSDGEKYCKVCKKQADNRSDGKPKFGTITDRLNNWDNNKLTYQPDGEKVEIPYNAIMTKLSITNDMVNRETNRLGWGDVPDIHFTAKKKGRGRPKKSKTKIVVSDSDEETTPKKRGRKKKNKVNLDELDDASLLSILLS